MKKRLIIASISVISLLIISAGVFFLITKSTPAFSSENFSVSKNMLECYTDYKKNEYVEYYTESQGVEYLETVKLDPDKSLKLQESCYGGSWYDYFYSQAKQELETALVYYEEALNIGLKLDAEEKHVAEKAIENFSGIDSNEADALAILLALSDKYINTFLESIEYDDNALNDFYSDNRQDFDCIDYKFIEINAVYKDENTGVEEATEAMKVAKAKADKLAEAIADIGFDKAVEEYLAQNGEKADNDKMSVIGYRCETNTQLGEWAFNDERKIGDVTVFEGRGQYSVYCIEKTAYPFDYTTRKIQKISLNIKNDDEAVQEIYAISEKYEASGKTAQDFEILAQENNQNGEIYEVWQESIDASYNDWIYGEAVNEGETQIFRDRNSVSIIRYCGEGESYYQSKLLQKYKQFKKEEHTDYLKGKISVK